MTSWLRSVFDALFQLIGSAGTDCVRSNLGLSQGTLTCFSYFKVSGGPSGLPPDDIENLWFSEVPDPSVNSSFKLGTAAQVCTRF